LQDQRDEFFRSQNVDPIADETFTSEIERLAAEHL